jgi:hypothetical protein
MYVDEMWLECVQGRAMQDVLAAKAIKKRPPRRALGDLTNRPSTPVAVAVPPTPPAALPKRPAPRRPEAKVEARPLATPRPETIILVEDHALSTTPLPTTEATDEADVAASHELLSNLSPPPNTTAQRGFRLAVRACVLAVVVAASASAGASIVHSAKAPVTEPVRAKAKFAWVSTTRPLRPPRWAHVQAVAPATTSRAAHMDSLARFLAAARGVVHKLPPPPPPRPPAFAWSVRAKAFPAGPARRVVPPP